MLFMKMPDVAGVASYIVTRELWSQGKINKRFRFLSFLGDMLILPQQQRSDMENSKALSRLSRSYSVPVIQTKHTHGTSGIYWLFTDKQI
jgi:hypothetical protein